MNPENYHLITEDWGDILEVENLIFVFEMNTNILRSASKSLRKFRVRAIEASDGHNVVDAMVLFGSTIDTYKHCLGFTELPETPAMTSVYMTLMKQLYRLVRFLHTEFNDSALEMETIIIKAFWECPEGYTDLLGAIDLVNPTRVYLEIEKKRDQNPTAWINLDKLMTSMRERYPRIEKALVFK